MLRLGLIAVLGGLGVPTPADPWAGLDVVPASQPAEVVEWVDPVPYRPPRPLFTPAPSDASLATARFGGEPGWIRVDASYCVETDGRVGYVRVKVRLGRFSYWGDRRGRRRVRKRFKQAISRWRFEPARVAGSPRRSCFITQFNVLFE